MFFEESGGVECESLLSSFLACLSVEEPSLEAGCSLATPGPSSGAGVSEVGAVKDSHAGSTQSVEVARTFWTFPTEDGMWQPLKSEARRCVPKFTFAHANHYFYYRRGLDNLPEQNFNAVNEHALLLLADELIQRLHVASSQSPDDTSVYFKGVCLPEMKAEKPYTLFLKMSSSAHILYTECGCSAGRAPSAACKHIAALCYTIEEFVRLGFTREKVTCTDHLARWNQPRSRSAPPGLLSDVSFKKAHYDGSSTHSVTDPKPCSCQRNSQIQAPPAEAIVDFAKAVLDISFSTEVKNAFSDVLPSIPALKERADRIGRCQDKKNKWKRENAMTADGCKLQKPPARPVADHPPPTKQPTKSQAKKIDTVRPKGLPASLQGSTLPWGGHLVHPSVRQKVYFSNTCPLDNFMIGLFILLESDDKALKHFQDVVFCPLSTLVLDIHKAFKEGRWIFGRWLWISLLLRESSLTATGAHGEVVDLYGSKYDHFTHYFAEDFMYHTTHAVCDRNCSNRKSKERMGYEILLTTRADLSRLDPPDQFAVMWHNFLHPSPDPCRQQCGGTCTWAQVELCPRLGTDIDCPVMLIMTFAQECLPNHSIRHPDQLPPEVNLPPSQGSVSGQQYKLFGCTFNDGSHFNSAFCVAERWYLYDGMLHGGKLSGVSATGVPKCLNGFKLSSYLYKACY